MMEFEKWWEKQEGTINEESCPQCCNYHTFKKAWRVALEHFNKLFLDGMHPQDVIFAMQKELED